MTNACASCTTENRIQARFCKRCGERLGSPIDDPFSALVGFDEVKAVAARLGRAMANSRSETGLIFSDRLHTIIIGNSGTGKTTLVQALAAMYHQHGVTKSPSPIVHDAVDFADFCKNFADNYKQAKGRILCIENVQKLIPAGYSDRVEAIDRLINEMSKPVNRVDPIVILSGQTQGFREFISANDIIRSKFPLIFKLHDFTAAELAELTAIELQRSRFQLAGKAKIKLGRVFQLALKNARVPDSEPEAKNGWAALAMAEKLKLNFLDSSLSRRPGLNEIACDDILDPVEVEKTMEDILQELDQFVGMEGIKASVRGLVNQVRVQQQGHDGTGKGRSIGFHIVLTGNPGTGKTSVARVLGETLRAAGVLELGHVIEADRGKLVAQHVGGTAPLVHGFCDRAQGGVLFIDEAYALKQSDSDTFGQEAIDTLLKRMEDDRGKLIVILAGYPNEIRKLLSSNPGLESRIEERFRFHLDDYTPGELLEIFNRLVKAEGYQLEENAKKAVFKHLAKRCAAKDKNFGNAREVRNLFGACQYLYAQRCPQGGVGSDPASQGGRVIQELDLPFAKESEMDLRSLTMHLDSMIGLNAVKSEVGTLIDYLKVEKIRLDRGLAETQLNLHCIFRGGPGTGKTTVARLLAKMFHGLGLLPSDKTVEVDRSGLVAQYLGQSAPKVNDVVDQAIGGVLFVDEAYALVGDAFGREAIDTLLVRMENDRGKFVVIAAGYPNDMERFLNSNSGLRSRFTNFIDFEDYSPRELMEIFRSLMQKKGMSMDQTAQDWAEKLFESVYNERDETFANGRTVRNIFEATLKRQSRRVAPLISGGATESIDLDLLNRVIAADIVDSRVA